jgi:hypothetical protein
MQKEPRKHIRPRPLSIVTRPWDENTTPLHQAICRVAPWDKRNYPGFRKTFLAILPRRITWDCVQHWLSGRTPVPAWAAEAIAEYFEGRWRSDRERADYWRGHAKAQRERIRPAQGCLRVYEAGRDRRGNWRQNS